MPPLIPISLAFAFGILLQRLGAVPLSLPFVVGLVALGVALAWRRRPWIALGGLLVLWLCAGFIRALSVSAIPEGHVGALVGPHPEPVAIHGVVIEDPIEVFSPNETAQASDSAQRPQDVKVREATVAQQVAVLKARHLRRAGGWQPTGGLIRVRLQDPQTVLAYGDEVVLEGEWRAPPRAGNPGQFDWQAALARQQIHALLAVAPFHGVVRVRPGQGAWWMRAIARLRQRLERLIADSLPERHAGLVRALVLGQRVGLDDELKRSFIDTGTMHLLVISGFHVGLIAFLLEGLLRLVGLPRRVRMLVIAGCLLGYWLLAGMRPPVTRATIMAWIVLGGVAWGRVTNWPNALAAAALVILCVNPGQLWDAGFQLSFGAVASLLLFAPRLRPGLESILGLAPVWLRRYLAISLASTAAIWLGLWPVIAWYFHRVSPVSILANLLLVPLVSLIVAGGVLLLGGGLLIAPLMAWGRMALGWLIDAMLACVAWCQQIPLGHWSVGSPSWFVMIGYYVLVAVTVFRVRLHLRTGPLLACWLIGLNLWIWGAIGARALEAPWLEITILDVGHGDSILIRTPSNHHVLVDAGTRTAGQYRVVPFLHHQGIHTLDALVLTHPDEDHLGGAIPVLRGLRVKQVFTNGFQATTPTAQQVLALVQEAQIPHGRLVAGMRIQGLSGADLTVLHPPPGFIPGTASTSNDNSMVLKVTHGSVSFLLSGDLESQGVPWALAWEHGLEATVLKVPHHGSGLGAWEREFFTRVHPAIAVISVGERFAQLPDSTVLEQLDVVGAQTFLTRDDGAVTIRTDGTRWVVTTYHGRRLGTRAQAIVTQPAWRLTEG